MQNDTRSQVEKDILEGLAEFGAALESGEPLEKKFTMRTVDLELEPAEYSPKDVKITREKLNASQAFFAKLIGVSLSTIQKWENDAEHPPSGSARRLLDLINRDPAGFMQMICERADGNPEEDWVTG